MAELIFYSGTMDSGKSTLALQLHHNHGARGRDGMLFTCNDRAGEAVISSRLGLVQQAREVHTQTDFWSEVAQERMHGNNVDYLVCDEVQFYRPRQVDQLASVVDELNVDVFAFGISTDFKTRLFPGSQRLIELADRVEVLQVPALCWCGKRATHNARTVDGHMVRDGSQVVIGDIHDGGAGAAAGGASAGVSYETLCRAHHRRGVTAATANRIAPQDELLPFSKD